MYFSVKTSNMVEIQRIVNVEDMEVGQKNEHFPCTKVISSSEASETIKCGDEMLQKTALCKDCHAVYKAAKANDSEKTHDCAALWQRIANYAKQHPKLAIGVGVGVGLALVATIAGASVPSAASASALALNSTSSSNSNSSSNASTTAPSKASTQAVSQTSAKAPSKASTVSSKATTKASTKAPTVSSKATTKASTKAPTVSSKTPTKATSKASTPAPASKVTSAPYSKCNNGQLFLLNIEGDRGRGSDVIKVGKPDTTGYGDSVRLLMLTKNNQTCHFLIPDKLYPSENATVTFMNQGDIDRKSGLIFKQGHGAIVMNSTRYDNSETRFSESCDIPAGYEDKCIGASPETKAFQGFTKEGYFRKA